MYNSRGSHGWLDDLDPHPRLKPILGDVRDPELMLTAVRDADVVLHLAALIGIPYSYVAPRSYVDTNVLGTLNVLEAVKRTGHARMIHTSTSEVYGTPAVLPITERHPLQAQSPYSASKIAADKLCESYARSFGTPVTILRPFNTFGPRQSARAVIPTILSQLFSGAPEIALGNTSPRRDFTFVSDTVDGFVRLAGAQVEPGTVIQLGTGQDYSIEEVFEACCRVVGKEVVLRAEPERVRPAGSEVETLLSDPSLAASSLGWRPTFTLEEGLKLTADWLVARGTESPGAYRI
jgi:UDP-glucose 4-epimerase